MRWRRLICFGAGLVVIAFFLALTPLRFAPPKRPNSSSAQLDSAAVQDDRSIVAIAPQASPARPVRFKHRLANTSVALAELVSCDHALLLENALIDTDQPLDLPVPESLRAQADPGAYIVQSKGPLDEAFRSRLLQSGASIAAYVPNNAWLVRADAAAALQISKDYRVQAVLPFHPYYKLKASLLSAVLEAPARAEDPSLSLNVLLFADSLEDTIAALNASDIQAHTLGRSPFGPVLHTKARLSQLSALARLPGVQEIEFHRPRVAANDLSRTALGVSPDTVSVVNYLDLTGTNVLINLNDTGVDATHPDLAGRLLLNTAATGQDPAGHGTHVAGVIAGSGAASITVTNAQGSSMPAAPAQFRGKAPGANLFAIAVDLDGTTLDDTFLQETAARTNAVISNNSWLYSGDTDYDLAAASFDAAVRDALPETTGSQPLICVFPAGNQGAGSDDGSGGFADSILSPATAKNVITVGALEQPRQITNRVWYCPPASPCSTNAPWLGMTDNAAHVSPFSSRGNVGIGVEGDSGRFKPDLVAPGTFVVSTRAAGWDESAYYTVTNGSGSSDWAQVLSNLNCSIGPFYRYESGTSLAGASVSGLLALIREFLSGRLGRDSSPAGMKAILINGARPLGPPYALATARTNFQGWGVANLTNSIPAALTDPPATPAPMILFDQEPGDVLVTGTARTRVIAVAANARAYGLRATLAWTDPPANPAVGIKLINNLDLVITNRDTGEVFFGNDMGPTNLFTRAWNTNSAPVRDCINNVENVFLEPPLGASYAVTVIGRRVNVNAITSETDGVAQDYALVISSGEGQVTDALTLSDTLTATVSAPEVTDITNVFPAGALDAGAILQAQRIGAHTAVSISSPVPLPGSPGEALTPGSTNQWRFYTFNNQAGFTNALFATFIPRATTTGFTSGHSLAAEPDVDLYVSTDPALTNLDPAALSAADKSLNRGGSEMIFYTNAMAIMFYVAVKCESLSGAEFSLAALSSDAPFATTDPSGAAILRGCPLPAVLPAGTPGRPSNGYALAVAPDPFPLHRVIVSNAVTHPRLGDLKMALEHAGTEAVLTAFGTNNAGTAGDVLLFDDSQERDLPNAQPSAGPSTLRSFGSSDSRGVWSLTTSSTNHAGTNQVVTLRLERQLDLTNGIIAEILPGACREEFFTVPPDASNVAVSATLVSGLGPLVLRICPAWLDPSNAPASVLTAATTNLAVAVDKWSNPPLGPGLYVARVCNEGTDKLAYRLAAAVFGDPTQSQAYRCLSSGPVPITDDALSTSTIHVATSELISSLEVGVRIDHPRISDLQLSLISPAGTGVLLCDRRGADSAAGMGGDFIQTNIFEVSASGGPEGSTNVIETWQRSGVISVSWWFYDLPDEMRVYYDGDLLYDSGYVTNTGAVNISYGPGISTEVTIIMNEGGNLDPDTAWFYRAVCTRPEHSYVTFAENAPAPHVRIKFAQPPFVSPGNTNRIFFLPEESLARFAGEPAAGDWKLEIQDMRAGAMTPPPVLQAWDLNFVLHGHAPLPIPLTHDAPQTIILGPGQVQTFVVDVPHWARFATNLLSGASAPVNLLFNQTAEPTGANTNDIVLLAGVSQGACTLKTIGVPALVPGDRYYLGIQNTNPLTATATLRVNFDVLPLANGSPCMVSVEAGSSSRYLSFDVSSNATAACFQFNTAAGNPALVAGRGAFPDSINYAAGSFNPGTNDEIIVLFPNESPALSPGRWFIGLLNQGPATVTGSIIATEYTNPIPPILSIANAGSYPVATVGLPGAVDYFRFIVGTNAVRAQFEVDQPSADVTLIAKRALPLPDLSTFDLLSANPGTNEEWIVFDRSSIPVRLTPGDWFLGVVNLCGGSLSYSISAMTFAALPPPLYFQTPFFDIGGSFCLAWNSVPGMHYTVAATPNLGAPSSWTTVSPTLVALDAVTSWCLPPPSPPQFFRVREGLALSSNTPPTSLSRASRTSAGVLLQWGGPTNHSFCVQWCDTLQSSWHSFTNVLHSMTGWFEFLDDGSQSAGLGPQRYYRLQQLP